MSAQIPTTPDTPQMSSNPTPSPYMPQSAGSGDSSRFIVVFGTKGGVGKTVVATNLAASLSQRTKNPVCLIDLDTMAIGDVSKMLNVSTTRSIIDLIPTLRRASSESAASSAEVISPNGSIYSADPTKAIRDSLAHSPIPFEGLMSVHVSGVHVLSCLSNPRQVGQLDPQALPMLFQALKSRYEYIVVDGGKMFTEPLIAAFDAANLILLVASPDVIALYQTKWALGMLESLLFPSGMVKAVLNRAESRGGVNTKDVRVVIPCEVIAEIPSDGHVVGTSVNRGVPIVTAFGQTKVAVAFLQLADQLIHRRDFYVAHQDIPRHQRPRESVSTPQAQNGMWATRLYSTDEGPIVEEVIDEIVLLKRRIHERLVEELDLKKLDLGSMMHSAQLVELRQKTERVIANLLAREIGGVAPSREVRARLVKEIADEALGLGPLEELLMDPEVTDILVNNKDQIYVERHGKLELTTRKFVSNDLVRAVIERIVAPLGRRIDESSPMVDARLPDGSRVNAVIPPLSIKGPALSIRKFSRIRYSQDDLVTFGSISTPMMQFIRACTMVKKNLIISGGTGSGKTTLLNIVSSSIPPGERIITIEDAAELQLAQTHWVCLETRPTNVEGKGQVTIRDLFRNALRMRPDRIIVGECRGAETLDMLQAMNTGHHGSITTIHANSPRDAISRMDSMVLMSNIELPLRAIREMVASAIDVIIHTSRLSDGTRKITAVTEVLGLGSDVDIQFQDIFVFRQTGVEANGTVLGEFIPTGKLPTFLDELRVKGIGLDESVFAVNGSSHTDAVPASLPSPDVKSVLKPPH